MRGSAAERWQRLLARQRHSGLGVAEFCRQEGVSPPSFYQWRRKLTSQGARPKQPSFVAVSVVSASPVEVVLPGGAVVRVPGGDERSLRQILTLLLERES